jgi:hypothetical protein
MLPTTKPRLRECHAAFPNVFKLSHSTLSHSYTLAHSQSRISTPASTGLAFLVRPPHPTRISLWRCCPAVKTLLTSRSADIPALTVAKSGRPMAWELVRTVQPPKVISARMGRFDAKGEVEYAQVTVRFDTEQVSGAERRGSFDVAPRGVVGIRPGLV